MPSDNLILLLILLALAVAGTVLLRRGLKGRQVGTTPHCFSCGFDLSGLANGATLVPGPDRRCSECGVPLAFTASIRVGHRVRRRWMIALGAALLAIPSTFFLLGVRSGNRVSVPIVQLPTPALIAMMHGNPGDEVIVELANRVKAGELDAKQIAMLGKRVLAQQGDLSRSWTSKWHYLGVAVYAAGGITAEDQYAGLRTSLTGRMEMRNKVRATGTQAIVVPMDLGRWLSITYGDWGVSSCTAKYHDERGNVVAVAESELPAVCGRGSAVSSPVVRLKVPDVPPGRYRIVYSAVMSATQGNWNFDGEQPVNVPLTAEREIEVVPSDQPVIGYSTPIESQVGVSPKIRSVRVNLLGSGSRTNAWVIAEFESNGLSYSYEVFIKPAGASESERIRLGSFVIAGSVSSSLSGGSACDRVPSGFNAERVDVIFEPDPFGAERNPDVSSIERAPIRVEGVTVTPV